MSNSAIVRRLAAILAADVVAYSRLMEADEVGTLAALKTHRRDFIDPVVAAHHGRLVKTTGDGLLLEFASVVDAVGCAVAIQRGMLLRNAAVPENKRIVLRIGINIGDIIYDESDIFGDGVNVAARLEALCEPGGVCISRAANEQIRDKLSLSFADLGEHAVKNITRAVGVYGLTAQDIAALPNTPLSEPPAAPSAPLPDDLLIAIEVHDNCRMLRGIGPPRWCGLVVESRPDGVRAIRSVAGLSIATRRGAREQSAENAGTVAESGRRRPLPSRSRTVPWRSPTELRKRGGQGDGQVSSWLGKGSWRSASNSTTSLAD